MKISITCEKNFSYDNDLIKVNSRFLYVENYYGEIKRINRNTGEVFICEGSRKNNVYVVEKDKKWGVIDKEQLDMINRNLSNLE